MSTTARGTGTGTAPTTARGTAPVPGRTTGAVELFRNRQALPYATTGGGKSALVPFVQRATQAGLVPVVMDKAVARQLRVYPRPSALNRATVALGAASIGATLAGAVAIQVGGVNRTVIAMVVAVTFHVFLAVALCARVRDARNRLDRL